MKKGGHTIPGKFVPGMIRFFNGRLAETGRHLNSIDC